MEFSLKKNKFWVTAVVAVATCVYFLSIDEPLNPQVPTLVETAQSEVTVENNGMVYLLGMWIASDESPYDVGLKRIQNSKLMAGKLDSKQFEPLEDSNSDIWLTELSDGEDVSELTCHYLQNDCLRNIWNRTNEIPVLIETYRLYLDRLEQLMGYERFSPPIEPSFSEPMIFYGSLIFSAKLKLLEVIYLAKNGEISRSSSELAELVRLNVNLLKNSPNVMTKVIASVQHEITMEVAAFLLSKTSNSNIRYWETAVTESSKLQPPMVSLKRPLAFEFVAMINSIRDELGAEAVGNHGQKNYTYSLAYKPNMTTNLLYEAYLDSFDSYTWSDGMIVSQRVKPSKRELPEIQYTNYVGSLLARTAIPRYLDVEDHFLEVYFRSIVLKHSFEFRQSGIAKVLTEVTLSSPYSGKQAYFKNGMLCMDNDTESQEPLCFYY